MITTRAVFNVHAGRHDDFRAAAFALADAAAVEPGTARYDWFEGADPSEYVVIEDYTDADAATRHNAACTDLLRRLGEVAELVSADLHGDLDDALQAWVAAEPRARAFLAIAR